MIQKGLLFLFFFLWNNVISNANVNTKNFNIDSDITIDFHIDRKGEQLPYAVTYCKEKVYPDVRTSTFHRSVFFNEFAEIISLVGSYNGITYSKIPYEVASATGDNVFFDDSKLAYFNYEFKGYNSVFEYSYKKRYTDLKYLTNIYFNDVYFVKEKNIVINIPEWLEVEIVEYNFEKYNIRKTIEDNGGIKKIIYSVDSLESFNLLDNSPSISQSYPHLIFLFKSFKVENEKHVLLSNTQDLYNWYRTLIDQVDNKSDLLKPVVNEIIKGSLTEEEKIERLYYWVQDNIRYIAFEDGIMGFKPDAAYNVYKKLYGDCKGMANLLTEMLKIAGFDARLTWIGTNSIPYDYSIPSLAVDNHMICTIFLNGKKIFLDATEEYADVNNIAQRIQNRPVLIEDGVNYILDKIPQKDYSFNTQIDSIELKLDNDVLLGNRTYKADGFEKVIFYRILYGIPSNQHKMFIKSILKSDNSNIDIISGTEILDFKRNEPLTIEGALKVKNQMFHFENEYYLNLNLSTDNNYQEIDSTRNVDFIFGRKYERKSITFFEIPAGFENLYLPADVFVDNDDFLFDFSYKLENKKIILTKRVIIKTWKLGTQKFDTWNNYIKKLDNFYKDQVVLKKV